MAEAHVTERRRENAPRQLAGVDWYGGRLQPKSAGASGGEWGEATVGVGVHGLEALGDVGRYGCRLIGARVRRVIVGVPVRGARRVGELEMDVWGAKGEGWGDKQDCVACRG